jgi:DNA-binding response OmpR family regulator
MNILVCEDDKSIRDLMQEIVEVEMNHKLFKSSNSLMLFSALEKNEINLIILDYWLNNNKAYKIILRLKNEYSKIPILLISAIANFSEISEKFDLNDYLRKPFEIEDLKNKINNLLNYDSEGSNNRG